jgi:hypothetical protein
MYRCVLIAACCLLGLAPGALAQSPTATIGGVVTDSTGAVVPAASVTILNAETGQVRRTTTSDGRFTAASLQPGRYTVTVQSAGFRTLTVQDVVLGANETRTLDLELQIGSIDESVTVEGSSLIDAETGTLGAHIDRHMVENLPLNGRSFNSLLALVPGAVLAKAAPGEDGQYSVNGQRTNANYYTVDGVSANAGVTPGSAVNRLSVAGTTPATTVLGGTNNLASIDAVQEVHVQTSTYAPEFGRMPGAQVSVVTRSGTNEIHGSLYEFLRNDALDANNWFANSRTLDKPPLRHNQFGGTVGGPILRDRTFFFVSYEALRLRLGLVGITAVPSPGARQRTPEALRGLIDAFPVSNGRSLGHAVSEFHATYSNPTTVDATSVRVDHTINSHVSLFGRYNYAPSEGRVRGEGFDSLNEVGHVRIDTDSLTIGSIQVLGARVTNDLRANVGRTRTASLYTTDDFGGARPLSDAELFPGPFDRSTTTRALQVEADAYFFVGKDALNRQRQLNVVDSLSVVAGSHQFRFGVDYRRIASVIDLNPYYFRTMIDVALRPIDVEVPLVEVYTNFADKVTPVFENFSAYAQDTWKVTPRLALTYGVRWELNPPPKDPYIEGAFLATVTGGPSSAQQLGPGEPRWKTTYTNFAPRVSAAYEARSTPGWETILRGGWGVFYDLGTGMARAPSIPSSYKAVGYAPYPIDDATLEPAPLQLTPPYGGTFNRVPAFASHLHLPRTYQVNLTVEQALGADQVLSLSYVGAFGRELLWNQVLVDPNPEFHEVRETINGATSDYNALQVHLERRLSHGLSALASYTWSHAIDTESSEFAVHPDAGVADPNADRASASFDVRHVVAAAIAYDLPTPRVPNVAKALLAHWSVDAIVQARTAYPVNVLSGSRLGPVFVGSGRPDVVPGVPAYLVDPNAPGGWRLNRDAFKPAPTNLVTGEQLRQGTLGRNALRGFGASQIDLALHRRVRVTGKLFGELRVEVFNLFNHPSFADPVARLNANAKFFGRSLSTLSNGLGGLNAIYQVGGPRSIQLALKLQF